MSKFKARQRRHEGESRKLRDATRDVVLAAMGAAPLIDVKANPEFAELRRAVTGMERVCEAVGVIPKQPETPED